MRPQVHSRKHYVQLSRSTAAANAEIELVIADSQIITAANLVNEVVEGSSVKAVFVELWALSDGNAGSTIVTLTKFPTNLASWTFAEMAAMGSAANKNNVLFFHQGLAANDGVGNPVPLIRQWFKIPKSKQRQALADRIILQMACQTPGTDTIDFCGFATYKEYF